MESRTSLVIGPRTRKNVLEGRKVRKGWKDGGDNFDDYFTDSDGESSTVSKSSILSTELPEKMPNVQSSNFFNDSYVAVTQSSQLKSKGVASPLKSKGVASPLKSKGVASPLKSKGVASPLKSKNVSSKDTVNADRHMNVNKETSTTELEEITVNLGVDDDNPETETLNKALDNIARKKIPKISSADIQEILCINNSPRSHTFVKKNEVHVSKSSFKSSKKSISRSTKKDAKTNKFELQYDELDERIMQMIHKNDDENEGISNSSDEEISLNEQNSSFMGESKDKSKREKHNIKYFGNIENKENFADEEFQSSESPNESIKINKSLNQSISDSKSLSFENIHSQKTEDLVKHKNASKQKGATQETTFTCLRSTVKKPSSVGASQLKEKSSETYISKKKLTTKRSHTADTLLNSDEVLSYSESNSDNSKTESNKLAAVNKNCLLNKDRNSLNSLKESSTVINDDTDSPSKNTRKQNNNNASKRNYLSDQHLSENVMPQKSLPSSPCSDYLLKKNKLQKNDAISKSKVSLENNSSNNNTIDDVSKSISKDISNMDDDNNVSEICMIEKEKTKNNKSDFIPNENELDAAGLNELTDLQTVNRRKTFFSKKSSIPEGDVNTSKNFSEDSDDVSETNMEKPSERQNKNDKNRPSKTNKKSRLIDKGVIEKAVLGSVSPLQTLKRSKTRNKSITEEHSAVNTSKNSSEKLTDNVSEINLKKKARKQGRNENDEKRQKETNKESSIPHEVIIETADLDYISQTSMRQKSRNSPIIEENDFANMQLNSSENSINSISEVKLEKCNKKQRKIKNNKSRLTSASSKSDFMSDEDIAERDDLCLSHLQTSKNSSHHKSVSIDKTTKKHRKNKKYKSNNEQKIADLSPQNTTELSQQQNKRRKTTEEKQTKKQKTSVSTRNNFTFEEENNPADPLENSSENCSVNNVSEITKKKVNVKSRILCDESDNDDKNQSKSVSIDKTAKKHRKNKYKSNNEQKMADLSPQKTSELSQQQNKRHKPNDLSQQQNKRQKKTEKKQTKKQTSVSTRNNFTFEEENNPADPLENSSENCSVGDVSEIIRKKVKSRILCDESGDDDNQSKAHASGKSKLLKNNINKENKESNHAGVRRSTRERFNPLAHWRNERLCYGFRDGNVETFGIDKGTKEDNSFMKSLYVKKSQKQKVQKPKKVEILDHAENKKKRVHLIKKFPLIPWDSPLRCKTDENPSHAFLIKRMLETKKNSFGYVHIDAGKTKPPQYMPDEDLLLTAIEGKVEVHLNDEVFVLERKDMFIVPRSTAYNITNIGKKRALLSYVVGRFKFLDDF